MSAKINFEYDAIRQVLIKTPAEGLPQIIEKENLVWRDLDQQDESYAKAIYLGQGCWERLDTITEEEARQILANLGYSSPNE